jgi:transposase InsO family protein
MVMVEESHDAVKPAPP